MGGKMIEKFKDILQFRVGTEEDEEGRLKNIVTPGSIVWGILLRTFILVLSSFVMFEIWTWVRSYWWFVFFIIWYEAAYPGWIQFQQYNENIEKVEESTLCGKCKHFDKTSQLCKILDEHITNDYVPCEGTEWDPKSE
jgi:hypothetical protein